MPIELLLFVIFGIGLCIMLNLSERERRNKDKK